MATEHEEYETEDVVIEFEGNFDLDGVADKSVQLIGIDSDEPVLRIDTKFYKINVQDSIGTRLLFQQQQQGTQSEGRTSLNYYAKTDKLVTAHRVIIKPK